MIFEVGDWVFLKLQTYKMRYLAKKLNEKFKLLFYGPYHVLERIGQVAYRLELPAHSIIHLVFHLPLLKKALGPHQQPQPLPQMLLEEQELEVMPDEMLGTRENSAGEVEVLIKWLHLPDCKNSWELAASIQVAFPDFHLEDKVDLLGEGWY